MQAKFFDAGPTDPLLNSRLCQMLIGALSPFPLTAVSSVSNTSYTVGLDTLDFNPSNAVCPPAFVWRFENDVLVGISGMHGFQQVDALVNGWNERPEPARLYGINPAFEQGAASLLAAYPASLRGRRKYFIVGHSYGGGVACALARFVSFFNPVPEVMLITYGQPRIGLSLGAEMVQRVGCTRFHLLGDPVPSIPPHRSESPSLAAILSRSRLAGWSAQTNNPTGWRLEENGQITQREDYGETVPDVFLTVRDYLVSTKGFSAPNHSIVRYNNAFLAGIPATPMVPPKPAPTRPEAPETIRPRDYPRFVQIGEAAVFADMTNPAGATRNYVPPPVSTLSAPRYRASRDGNLWVIRLGDDIVGGATGKRQAKRLARAWNKSARAALYT